FGIDRARLWRRADDAGADEGATGFTDHVRDLQHGTRADRIAFDVNRFLVGSGQHGDQALGEAQRVARRDDRHQEIRFGQLRVGHRGHAGGARAFGACLAAAGERGQHPHVVLGQALGNAGAHIAGRDEGDNGGHALVPYDPVTPPSRLMLWPVTKADASEARNNAAPTRSSGTSARGTACMAMMRSFCAGVTVLRSISVKVAPGRMALTVMLSTPNSRAIDRLMPASAALAAI